MDRKQQGTIAIAGIAVVLCAAAVFLLVPASAPQAPPQPVEPPTWQPPPPPRPVRPQHPEFPVQRPQRQDWGIRSDDVSPVPERRCIDSDAGNEEQRLFVAGTTEEDGVLGQDHCSNSDTLVEFYCYDRPRGPERRRFYGQRYYCPNGCSKGACRPITSGHQPRVRPLHGSRHAWHACRGTGSHVCAEKVPTEYSRYLRNHPECIINFDCGGRYWACNEACPEPGPQDR
jgi:hypothetical protein